MFSFLRRDGEGTTIACIANFSGVPRAGYRLGLPWAGAWSEVINTDAGIYAGSGVGNLGTVQATADPWHGLPASATLTLPPLGTLWLRAPEPASLPSRLRRGMVRPTGSNRSQVSIGKVTAGAVLLVLGVVLWIMTDLPAYGLVSGLGVVILYVAAEPWLERWRNS